MRRRTLHRIALGVVLFAAGFFTPASFGADKEDPTISLHGNDKHFQEYMQELAEQAEVEVQVAENLGGTCGMDLYDLPLEDALDTLVALYDVRWYRRGGVIHVVSEEQFRAANPEAPKEKPAGPENKPRDNDRKKKDRKDTGTVDLRVDDLEAGRVFQILSIQGQRNIVRTDQVSDKLTLELKGVTFDQIIDHIVELNGWKRIELDHALWIASQEEYERWQARQAAPDEEKAEGKDAAP